jgi:hypothetical protein
MLVCTVSKGLYSEKKTCLNQDYAASLAAAVEKWFWGPLCFGDNLPKAPFLRPTPLIVGMIAQISLKK